MLDTATDMIGEHPVVDAVLKSDEIELIKSRLADPKLSANQRKKYRYGISPTWAHGSGILGPMSKLTL